VYLLERTVDHVARQIGIDRMELRRRNMLRPEELPFQTALGLRYDSGDFPAMFETALQRADYATFSARKAEAASRGRRRGIGLAHYCERVAGSWGEHGWMEMGQDGRVRVMVSTMSNGQGHATAYAQLVADRLGIEPEDVEVIQGDTDRTPFGHGTGGSASLPIAGAALAVAATELIQKALPLAAEALEAAAADVVFADGRFRIVGTDRAVGLAAVAARLAPGAQLEADGFWKPDGPTFPNGCHVAEVEVDPETGAWTVERYTMLHDFGLVLNPMLLQGQLQGGVTQGIGQAAGERVVHDAASGQLLTGSWLDYQLPRADEVPPLVLETLATAAPANPLGVKGCGEAGAAGGAPAVMNALADALADGLTGGRTIDMPATAERVWRALRG
jgi:carbon-monoxide dehydrogenase large subunit